MFALVEYKGKQFKIEEGSQIRVPLVDAKVGTKVAIDKVIYLNNKDKKEFGSPYLSSVSIPAKVLSHSKEQKIVVFKMKRRKGYQKKNGHKQPYTLLEIGKFKSTKTKAATKSTKSTDTTKKAEKKKPTTTKKTTAKKKDKE